MTLTQISDTLIDEASSPAQLRAALDAFALLCSGVSGVVPDRSFDAWAGDSLLADGVAINPGAAAHCVTDYRRSVVFIRAVNSAIKAAMPRFANQPIEILYAGCGPYATLLLPLLGRFKPGSLDVHLLDIHQRSLDSVRLLIDHFGLESHRIHFVQGDACSYQHPTKPHIIVAETMQKSLEQEPQFAVTANLAPQLHSHGIFIPQEIEVELCLAQLDNEAAAFKQGETLDPEALVNAGKRHPLSTVLRVTPENAATLLQQARRDSSTGALALAPLHITVPPLGQQDRFDPLLFTRIRAFEQHQLLDYESEITLPLRCHDMAPLREGTIFEIRFQLGGYPGFCLTRIDDG